MQAKLNTVNKQIEQSAIYKDVLETNQINLNAIMQETFVSTNPDPDKAFCEEIIENVKISSAIRNGKRSLHSNVSSRSRKSKDKSVSKKNRKK